MADQVLNLLLADSSEPPPINIKHVLYLGYLSDSIRTSTLASASGPTNGTHSSHETKVS